MIDTPLNCGVHFLNRALLAIVHFLSPVESISTAILQLLNRAQLAIVHFLSPVESISTVILQLLKRGAHFWNRTLLADSAEVFLIRDRLCQQGGRWRLHLGYRPRAHQFRRRGRDRLLESRAGAVLELGRAGIVLGLARAGVVLGLDRVGVVLGLDRVGVVLGLARAGEHRLESVVLLRGVEGACTTRFIHFTVGNTIIIHTECRG
jgi:hypothetical protein